MNTASNILQFNDKENVKTHISEDSDAKIFKLYADNKDKSKDQPKELNKKAHIQAKKIKLTEELFKDRTKAPESITIDGSKTKDRDDAISVEKTEDGYIAHITIADVSSVVKPGSFIDLNAKNKQFTRYLKNGNDPMIPHSLSEGLLSLDEGKKRPTLTFSVPVSDDIKIGIPEIKKTYVTSKKAFTYEEADKTIKNENNEFHKTLNEANTLAQKLSKKRTGKIIYRNSPSHLIIQELMVLANSAVAEYCDKHNIPILYRNHKITKTTEMIDESNLSKLRNKFTNLLRKIINYKEHGSSAMKIVKDTNEKTTDVIGYGYYSPKNVGHDGLNRKAYAHFTSDIRRAPDLFALENINRHLDGDEFTYNNDDLEVLGSRANKIQNEIKGRVIHSLQKPKIAV